MNDRPKQVTQAFLPLTPLIEALQLSDNPL
jgi:hypothetical protein